MREDYNSQLYNITCHSFILARELGDCKVMKTLSFSNQCTSKEDELSLCPALLSVLGNFSCRRTLNISPAASMPQDNDDEVDGCYEKLIMK